MSCTRRTSSVACIEDLEPKTFKKILNHGGHGSTEGH